MIGAVIVLQGAIAWRTERLTAAGTSEVDPGQPARLIAALDSCIQERFKEINERFGIRRVIRIGETPHMFKPEQATELAAVTAFEEANLRVVLYLTGRQVQAPKPDTSRWGQADVWRLIKGPVAITSELGVPGTTRQNIAQAPPPPLDLWDDSRRAFQAFDSSDSHEFARGTWRFIAKPVRASEAVCLTCHDDSVESVATRWSPSRPVQLGDPLGVVLYGYQPR